MRVIINAPAKLNLSLDIVGRRADGYHLLKMVTQSVDLCDTVTVSTDSDDEDVPIRLLCDEQLPQGGENAAVKAAAAFFEETSVEPLPITIKIKKKIPVAAGLGGGSADAAAVIIALDELFDTRLSYDELCEIGEKVGSDVPACIVGGIAFIEGTGALINPLPDLPECWFVLVKDGDKPSTGQMYAEYDKLTNPKPVKTQAVVDAVCLGDLREIGKNIGNVFEALWQKSNFMKIKNVMMQNGALGCTVTGSGPTVFGVFESKNDASDCVSILKKDYDEVYICQPTEKGSEII